MANDCNVKKDSCIKPDDPRFKEVKVGVVSSIHAAKQVLNKIAAGELELHFLEVMACPGGCVHGGGQPHVSAKDRIDTEVRSERAKALYSEDKRLPHRKSHENEEVKALYDEFFKEPNSPISHKYLHTHYAEQFIYMPDVVERV